MTASCGLQRRLIDAINGLGTAEAGPADVAALLASVLRRRLQKQHAVSARPYCIEDLDACLSVLRRWNETQGPRYPAVLDASGSVAIKYSVTALPQTIFINRNGTVMSRVPKELTAQALSSNLQLII